MMREPEVSNVEHARRAIGRAGYLAAMSGLVIGVVLLLPGHPTAGRGVLVITIGILLSLPVVNVIAILAEEVRRRDWSFALIAIVVLALLAFNVVRRLFA